MHRAALLALALAAAVHAQTPAAPKTHRLEATPQTVAYGYYWSEAKPVLTIASGDIIDVDTLLTNTPMRLERSGAPASPATWRSPSWWTARSACT